MKTYTIGEMAKICGISARQLRYYDQIGVIRPNYRNPDWRQNAISAKDLVFVTVF